MKINEIILILKNISHEGPGLIAEVFKKEKIAYHVINLSENIDLPKIDSYRLVIVMGGPDSANDNTV
ncbi:MAG: hypothetical protein JW891_12140 [Candidatus Lokiarchaeota archaeon]|nr:hypothetical protein [Candidatus Lokiarchaeota archaeon]